MYNVTFDNQIKLNHDSYKKAWKDHKDELNALLKEMNIEVDDLVEQKKKLKQLQEEIAETVKIIAQIEDQMKKSAKARKKYWGHIHQHEQEMLKKHPRKYKTKWIKETSK